MPSRVDFLATFVSFLLAVSPPSVATAQSSSSLRRETFGSNKESVDLSATPTSGEGCPTLPLGMTSKTICSKAPEGFDSIALLDMKTPAFEEVPAGVDLEAIFHGLMHHQGSDDIAGEVTFSLHHPFGADVEMNTIIEYHVVGDIVDNDGQGATNVVLEPTCELQSGKGCPPEPTPVYRAGCIQPKSGGPPFTVVTVVFVAAAADNAALLGDGGQGINLYPICPNTLSSLPMVEYTFKILCDCPAV